MIRSIRTLLLLGLPLVMSSLVGCGGGEARLPESGATLEGTVEFRGEPLHFAMILVQGEKDAAQGKIGEDGRYKVPNAPLGPVKIGVNTAAAQGDSISSAMAGGANKGPGEKGKGRSSAAKFVAVPPQYFDPNSSGVTTTIQKGSNTYDIKLK